MTEEKRDQIVPYVETGRELNAAVPTVHGYCRRKLLVRAKLPGYARARGVTRASLNRLLEQIGSGDMGKVVGHE